MSDNLSFYLFVPQASFPVSLNRDRNQHGKFNPFAAALFPLARPHRYNALRCKWLIVCSCTAPEVRCNGGIGHLILLLCHAFKRGDKPRAANFLPRWARFIDGVDQANVFSLLGVPSVSIFQVSSPLCLSSSNGFFGQRGDNAGYLSCRNSILSPPFSS